MVLTFHVPTFSIFLRGAVYWVLKHQNSVVLAALHHTNPSEDFSQLTQWLLNDTLLYSIYLVRSRAGSWSTTQIIFKFASKHFKHFL